jgi:2-oxoglutarate dehydrogenase complex dehydrogenase (E1) component-like enzyme
MTTNQIKSETAKKTVEAMIDLSLSNQIKYTEDRINGIVDDANEKLEIIKKACNDAENKLDSFLKNYAVKEVNSKNMDARALSAFTLFASLMELCKARTITKYPEQNSFSAFASGEAEEYKHILRVEEEIDPKVIESLSYIVYAYLGGQARRIYEKEWEGDE